MRDEARVCFGESVSALTITCKCRRQIPAFHCCTCTVERSWNVSLLWIIRSRREGINMRVWQPQSMFEEMLRRYGKAGEFGRMGSHGSGTHRDLDMVGEYKRPLCLDRRRGAHPRSGVWTMDRFKTPNVSPPSRLRNTVLARHGGRVDLELSLDGMWTECMFQPLLQTETCMLLHTRRAFETSPDPLNILDCDVLKRTSYVTKTPSTSHSYLRDSESTTNSTPWVRLRLVASLYRWYFVALSTEDHGE